jgi:hypothetical protein
MERQIHLISSGFLLERQSMTGEKKQRQAQSQTRVPNGTPDSSDFFWISSGTPV